jgi:hypothetical protein
MNGNVAALVHTPNLRNTRIAKKRNLLQKLFKMLQNLLFLSKYVIYLAVTPCLIDIRLYWSVKLLIILATWVEIPN